MRTWLLSSFVICILATTSITAEEKNFTSLCNSAMDLYYKHEFDKAIELYKKALSMKPESTPVHFNIGYIFSILKKTNSAIKHLQLALQGNPCYTKAHFILAQIFLEEKKDIEQAMHHYKKTIELDPHHFDATFRLGQLYYEQDNWNKAQKLFEKTVQLKPKSIIVRFDLASLFLKQHNFDAAIEQYKKILKINPSSAVTNYNMAYALKLKGAYQESIPYYKKAIKLNPKNEKATFGYAKSSLAMGYFEQGWKAFEYRMASQEKYRKTFNFHGIQPDEFKNKTVLIRAEFGLGDTIHFIRYAQLVKKCGAKKVYVETFGPLVQLLSNCNYIDKAFAKKTPLPRHDIQIPLLSFPMIFDTRLNTVPQTIPYINADKKLIRLWKNKLNTINSNPNQLNVGLCWQANPNTFLEDNPLTKRSIPLSLFEPLTQLKNVKLYSLQRQYGADQINNLPDGFFIHDFGPDFDTTHGRFMDTAAVISNLDLVITVDTAIAHLSGALGTQTWILLPSVAEWRWMTDGTTTPWYPQARLFRQQTHDDWKSVINEIADEIRCISKTR